MEDTKVLLRVVEKLERETGWRAHLHIVRKVLVIPNQDTGETRVVLGFTLLDGGDTKNVEVTKMFGDLQQAGEFVHMYYVSAWSKQGLVSEPDWVFHKSYEDGLRWLVENAPKN